MANTNSNALFVSELSLLDNPNSSTSDLTAAINRLTPQLTSAPSALVPALSAAIARLAAALAIHNDSAIGPVIVGGNGGPVYIPQFLIESAANNITAFAAGGQASATLLTAEINVITTAAALGASIKLPSTSILTGVLAAGAMDVMVVNLGANTIQVYGAGADTINGVATGTGVSQMPNSVAYYVCGGAGAWQADVGFGYSGGIPTQNYTEGAVARAGGSRALATTITTSLTRIITVATAGDSVVLPTAVAGVYLTVINAAASNAMQVFAAGSDTIDGIAGATGYSQAAGKTVNYMTTAAGSWHKMISA